ncbi:hypothetical protein Zmor_014389 [Zophobas morio]|uniref:RNA-directed DNA polymerase from mobile element jockey n=1 Tax=Zophobas morio TaxID=2755281 RepID=A0AA38MGD8_9CUCU|nr:hypothetical protein Zmor_014389 [Zophobas morio]
MTLDAEELSSPYSIAEGFADLFSSVYSSKTCHPICDTFDSVCDNNGCGIVDNLNCDTYDCDMQNVLHTFHISMVDIKKAVKKLKSNFTSGPDKIPAFLVKDCINCFCEPLCYLYNLIVQTSTFPKLWKIAKVIPIFKSGSKSDVTNYRPVSVISNFAKIFDSILTNILLPLVLLKLFYCRLN